MENAQNNSENRKSKNVELEYQLNAFEKYRHLPAIVAIIILVLTFIWGIVDPCIFQSGGYYSDDSFGVMQLPSGFLCWLIWMLIGGVIAFINYKLLTISYSYRLLHIYYLQKLVGDEPILLCDDEENDEVEIHVDPKSEGLNFGQEKDTQEEKS